MKPNPFDTIVVDPRVSWILYMERIINHTFPSIIKSISSGFNCKDYCDLLMQRYSSPINNYIMTNFRD